ncbi:ricin-type beta-trefoil lectin domain protein [Streptomyces sp. NPDC001948]
MRGMCVDISGNSAASGLWTCVPGVSNQVWLPRADGSLYNPATDHCLDLPNNDTAPGWPPSPVLAHPPRPGASPPSERRRCPSTPDPSRMSPGPSTPRAGARIHDGRVTGRLANSP